MQVAARGETTDIGVLSRGSAVSSNAPQSDDGETAKDVHAEEEEGSLIKLDSYGPGLGGKFAP